MPSNQMFVVRKSNLKGFFQLILHLGMISIVIFLGCYFDNPLSFTLLFLLNGVLVSFLSTTGAIHELVHSTVFGSRYLNKIFYELLCLLTWTNAIKFRATHFYHHKNFGDQYDTESNSTNLSNIKFREFLSWIFIDANRLISIIKYFYYAITGTVDSKDLVRILDGHEKEFIIRERLMYFINISILLLLLSSQSYKLIFFISLSPFTCTFFSKVLANIQHIKISDCDRTNLLERSTSISLSPLFAFLYWNMNYHIEHHLYPGVPFHQLPELSSKLLASGKIVNNRMCLSKALRLCNKQNL
jgi:fatty acid desaturase